jgi:hypothetical protein
VLLGPACWCLVTAQPLSPAISRTPPLTPGPPSRSGPRVSHPHHVARAHPLPLPYSRDNATARARRPGAIAGRPALPTSAPGPPSSLLLLHAAAPAGPPPFFPTLPRATEPLEKLLAAALSPFFIPFPSHPRPSTCFLRHLPLDPVEQLERWEPPPCHRNCSQHRRRPTLSVSRASELALAV